MRRLHLAAKWQARAVLSSVTREQFGAFSVLHRPAKGRASATVHFAHATGFNAETYRPLLEELDATLDVYAMDARGHGLSTAEADPRALRSWAPFRRDLETFLDHLRPPLALAGHSMGATVSMEVAAARPDLVGGLVLVDPVIVPPGQIPLLAIARFVGLSNRLIPISQMAAKRRMEFPSKEAAVRNFVGKGPFKTWPRTWIEAYIDGGTRPLIDGGVRLTCEREWESRTFAVATVRPYRPLRRVRCPITLIAREPSSPPFTRAARDAFLKEKPHTRLLLLEEVSHFMTMERPDLVRTEIETMTAMLSKL